MASPKHVAGLRCGRGSRLGPRPPPVRKQRASPSNPRVPPLSHAGAGLKVRVVLEMCKETKGANGEMVVWGSSSAPPPPPRSPRPPPACSFWLDGSVTSPRMWANFCVHEDGQCRAWMG